MSLWVIGGPDTPVVSVTVQMRRGLVPPWGTSYACVFRTCVRSCPCVCVYVCAYVHVCVTCVYVRVCVDVPGHVSVLSYVVHSRPLVPKEGLSTGVPQAPETGLLEDPLRPRTESGTSFAVERRDQFETGGRIHCPPRAPRLGVHRDVPGRVQGSDRSVIVGVTGSGVETGVRGSLDGLLDGPVPVRVVVDTVVETKGPLHLPRSDPRRRLPRRLVRV